MKPASRILLMLFAGVFFVWEHLAMYWWIKSAGSFAEAWDHAGTTLTSDWLVLLVFTDASVFTLGVLIWLWRDLGRRGINGKSKACWFGSALLWGCPAWLFYLARRPLKPPVRALRGFHE